MAISGSFVGGLGDAASGTALTYPSSGSFDSTGYTHLLVGFAHEGADQTATPSANNGTTGWVSYTKRDNAQSDAWVQLFSGKIGAPGTGQTATVTTPTGSPYRSIYVWLLNSATGEIELAHATPANAEAAGAASGVPSTALDAGTLITDAAAFLAQIVAPYEATSFTPGASWTEDADLNGVGNYGFAQSRTEASAGTFDPVCTLAVAGWWCSVAIALKEAAGGGGGGAQPPRSMHQSRLRRAA